MLRVTLYLPKRKQASMRNVSTATNYLCLMMTICRYASTSTVSHGNNDALVWFMMEFILTKYANIAEHKEIRISDLIVAVSPHVHAQQSTPTKSQKSETKERLNHDVDQPEVYGNTYVNDRSQSDEIIIQLSIV